MPHFLFYSFRNYVNDQAALPSLEWKISKALFSKANKTCLVLYTDSSLIQQVLDFLFLLEIFYFFKCKHIIRDATKLRLMDKLIKEVFCCLRFYIYSRWRGIFYSSKRFNNSKMQIRNANKALLIHWRVMKRFCRNLIILIIIHSNQWLGRWKNTYLKNEQKVWSVSPKQTGLKWNKLMKKGDPSQPRGGLGKDEEPSSSLYGWGLKGLIQSFKINKICDFSWFTF